MLNIAGRTFPCMEVIEYFKTVGSTLVNGKLTQINYEWHIRNFYGAGGLGALMFTYHMPECDWGYGKMSEANLTGQVITFGYGF